jgi:hypothetical protein
MEISIHNPTEISRRIRSVTRKETGKEFFVLEIDVKTRDDKVRLIIFADDKESLRL